MKEIAVELAGKTYSVRPDFRRIQSIESMTNRGTVEIAQDIAEGKYKVVDIVNVLFCMIRDPKVTQDRVAEEVVGRVDKYLAVVIEFLAACNFGSDELSGGGTEGNA